MLYTIGHSNHAWERFSELITEHGIETLVDVRTVPYSRYSPHFNKDALERQLPTHGVRYVFMGHELGGRPENAELYDEKGYALYDRFAKQPFFRSGIACLKQLLNGEQNVVLMCSEADPNECHRRLLIAWYLYKTERIDSLHIYPDGKLVSESELQNQEPLSLFEDDAEQVSAPRRSVKKIAG
jgi:uncharacterized protein (DUF488 family)